MKRMNPGYKINICQIQALTQINSCGNENVDNNKEKLKDKRVKINADLPNKSALNLVTKKSIKSILKSKRSFRNNYLLNSEGVERKDRTNIVEYPKSSLNVKNNISNKSFLSPSILDVTSNKSHYNRKNLDKTKNEFLKLINPNSVIKRSKISDSGSLFFGKDFEKELEEDSLNLIEMNLKNKIYDMGKEADFLDFEINPLELSVNRLQLRQKKRKSTHKMNKKENFNIKRHKTVINKNIFNQLNTNRDNSNSGDFLLSKDNKSFIFNNKQHISNNRLIRNITGKSTKSKKKSLKNINNNKNNMNNHYYKINVIGNNIAGRRSSINHFIKSSFNSTIINRSKTALNSKSSSTSNKGMSTPKNKKTVDIPIIKVKKGIHNTEKYRILSHKKLVYDSLDDEEVIEDAINDNFYIHPDHKMVQLFDSLIFIFAFYCIIYKPLKLVLNNCDIKNEIMSYNWENITNILIDFLFITDVIINFFKAFYNFDEQLITKSEKIILNYIKGYFIIDFISGIPYYSIFKLNAYNNHNKLTALSTCSKYYNHKINDLYQIMELLKIIKLIKYFTNNNILLDIIINNLNQISFFDSWSFLLSNIFMSLLILHLTACIHIFISSTAFPNWIVYKGLHESSFIHVYLSSIYFLITTVTSVGYGDIIGNSNTEIVFQIILLLIGIIAYSWLISSLSNYVKENNSQNEIFNKKLSILNEIKLEHPIITKDLYDKIHLHLEYINLRQKKDKSSLIDCLPHSIRKPLLYEMYKPIIDNFIFFKNFKNSEFVNRVISKLKPVLAVKNDLLLEQGEIIEDTIFVKQGRLSLEVKIDTNHPEKSIEKLLNEEYFFGIENNELYQKNALGGLINMASNYSQSFINKKNLYNLYSGNKVQENNYKEVKSIITNIKGEPEIQKHPNININYIHLRILDIRKNEHFGALLMFLNKRSPLSLRVKTKKAELFFLKKIDAVGISTSYPNIWKRVNKKSFHNLKQIKNIMKKIIKHFCETYGINFDFSSKIYNIKKKDLKKIKNLQKLNLLPNPLIDQRKIDQRMSSVIERNAAQLKMFKHFPKQTNIFSTKTNVEKEIERLVPKTFEINENNNFTLKKLNNSAAHSKDMNIDNKSKTKNSISQEDNNNPIDCDLSMIKIKKKDSYVGYGHPNYIRNNNNDNDNNFGITNESNGKMTLDKSNKNNNINQSNKLKITSNQKIIQYGVEETNNLMKFFGTPYYPEDINDEVYPGENFSIYSQRGNNIYEQEYSPVDDLLLSYDTNKNKMLKLKSKSNAPPSFDMNSRSNNFTINNNYITNNVINNISAAKNVNNHLSVFHFDIKIISNKNQGKKTLKLKTEKKINLNLSVFKNAFEISSNNINKSSKNKTLYINNHNKKTGNVNNVDNINNDLKSEITRPKYRKNNSCVDVDKKIKANKKKDSFSSNCSYSHSNSNIHSDNELNDMLFEALAKNVNLVDIAINTPKQLQYEGDINNNIDDDGKLKIKRNIIFKINAKYENLNVITKGLFSKSKNLQKCVKKLLNKKILKHDKNNLYLKPKSLEKEQNNNLKNPVIQKRKSISKNLYFQKKKTMQKKKTIQNNLVIKKKLTMQRKPITKKLNSIQTIRTPKSPVRQKPRKPEGFHSLLKNKTITKNLPEGYSCNNIVKDNVKKEKLRKTELKSLFNKPMISDIHDKNTIIRSRKNNSRIKDDADFSSNSIPKRRKTRKNDDDFFLDYVNRNIRDDNAVLNNPGQFYNGFFNDIMKRVNQGKNKQKETESGKESEKQSEKEGEK